MNATSKVFSSGYNKGRRKGRFARTRMESPLLDIMVRRKIIAVVQSDFKQETGETLKQQEILEGLYP